MYQLQDGGFCGTNKRRNWWQRFALLCKHPSDVVHTDIYSLAGVDVILDILGAAYFQRNLDALNFDERLFVIGTMGGLVTELDLRVVLAKRLTIQAAGLRSRSRENKAFILSETEKNVWSAIAAGKVKTVIYKHFRFSQAAEAHQLMESSRHVGKILLLP
ncbi:hypothetical protein ABKV19_006684 [Rosa sericea]